MVCPLMKRMLEDGRSLAGVSDRALIPMGPGLQFQCITGTSYFIGEQWQSDLHHVAAYQFHLQLHVEVVSTFQV